MKKYVMSREERTTAMKPAMTPPNQALPMIALKKEKDKMGNVMTCCKGNVQSSATTTKQVAMAEGLRAYWNVP